MGVYKVTNDKGNGIIVGDISGNHTLEDAENMLAIVLDLMEENGESRKILLVMSKVGRPTSDARKFYAKIIRSNQYNFQKLALYGANTRNRVMANFIIKASGKDNFIKYFDSRKNTLRWLKN